MGKPFLRWAGSKRKLLPVLSSYWSRDSKRYVEPFAGSACLFFHLSPKKALLGDINSELMFAYTQVRDHLHDVLDRLRSLRKGKRQYLALRAINPDSLVNAERAARFIYLNRFCFNGLYRTNEAGYFNVPYGGWRAGRIPSDDEFKACSQILQHADLSVSSFEMTLAKVKDGDFVYLDPPYSVAAKRVFKQYDATAFDEVQIELLRTWLIRFAKRSVRFLATYADCREGRYLAQGFHARKVAVRRNIAGFSSERRRAYELLISN